MRMLVEEWKLEFKPIPNHLDDNAGYDGLMFETYEPEYSFVRDSNKFQWTLVESDGTQFIIPGLHHVNRLGYFLTEEGYHGRHDLIIDIDDIFSFEQAVDATVKYMESIITEGRNASCLYDDIVDFYNEKIR